MRRSDFMDSHSRHLRTMPRRRAPLASASPEAALRDNLFFCDGEGEAHLPLLTAGVDEAGRGPLAGPVCAAAVILDPENPIEGLTRQLRKVTKSKTVFPSDDSLLKMLYLATMDITKKWTGHRQDWGQIHSQLEIYFEERLIGHNL